MVKDNRKGRKMFVVLMRNCATELKLLFAAVLFLVSITTFFQLFPSGLSFSVADFRRCVSASTTYGMPVLVDSSVLQVQEERTTTPPPPGPPAPSRQVKAHDEVLEGGLIVKRAFNPYGTAAYNFILMSAYRGGLDTFALVGLTSKPLQVFGNPSYECEWLPHPNNNTTVQQQPPTKTLGVDYRPDWNMGQVYAVVVVNCTFPVSVGMDPSGGTLLLHASTNGGGDSKYNLTDTIQALTEAPGSLNVAQFTDPPKYEYLYCGSPLYGDLSPQRLREWLAYHIKLFGPRSHFVIYDAGGVHTEVMKVLRPWMEKGYITLEDIKEQERFDGYYHNQFLVVNDCLFRYRFMTKRMFFFDVDEFVYVPSNTNFVSVMDYFSNYTHFSFEQMPMSEKLCHSNEDNIGQMKSKWGFEKLVYRDTKLGIHSQKDRKYAVSPRSLYATGVHFSQSSVGLRTDDTGGRIMYFHYHGTITRRQELCQQLFNATELEMDGITYVLDTRVQEAAESVKRFELEMIGPVLQSTPL